MRIEHPQVTTNRWIGFFGNYVRNRRLEQLFQSYLYTSSIRSPCKFNALVSATPRLVSTIIGPTLVLLGEPDSVSDSLQTYLCIVTQPVYDRNLYT